MPKKPSTSDARRIRIERATEPQREFWASDAKFTYFRGGVGSGKTVAGVVKAMSMPAGSTGMILAPTYPMLRDATLRTFLEITRKAGVLRDYHKGDKVAVLQGRRTAYFRTANDPEKLRGPNLGWFWPDEACLMKPLVWPIMIGRLREEPREAWLTSTPRGKNWVHDTFDKGGREYRLVKASSRTNVFQPEEFVRSMAENYSADFARQEIDGEVLEDAQETLVPDWWLDTMELVVRPKGAPGAGRRRMGVDLGYGTGRDSFTAIVRDDLGILWGMESAFVGVPQAAAIVAEQARRLNIRPEDVAYDAAGPGRDMHQYLAPLGYGDAYRYFGERSGYATADNRRSLVAWRMRERLDPERPMAWQPDPTMDRHAIFMTPKAPAGVQRQAAFALPPNRPWWPRLREEIQALKYAMVGRKVKLELKKDLMARLKRSPNNLDAFMMTFNEGEVA